MTRMRQRGAVLFIALIVLVAMSLAGIALIRGVDTANLIAGVITSYSIHYTKLYDAVLEAVRAGRIPESRIDESVARVLAVKAAVASGPSTDGLAALRRPESLALASSRITSYNVCYTKLLRP